MLPYKWTVGCVAGRLSGPSSPHRADYCRSTVDPGAPMSMHAITMRPEGHSKPTPPPMQCKGQ